MYQYILKIDGMRCAMCEAHIKDVIRRELPSAKKVTASRAKGEASFWSEEAVNERQLQDAIAATGYCCGEISAESCKKRGWFGWK
ncbi:MAG: heavy-metal-associated domain-containing protein [Oscillospiraceae bacterium]|nr:heavy-metal-associated domain-containing protein [Oscillospiraceae bacterium]